jgi:hypothetical protein
MTGRAGSLVFSGRAWCARISFRLATHRVIGTLVPLWRAKEQVEPKRQQGAADREGEDGSARHGQGSEQAMTIPSPESLSPHVQYQGLVSTQAQLAS